MVGRAGWAGLVLVALVGLWGAAGEAWAGRRVALLIGNRDYEHQTALGTPLNDINLIEKTLKDLRFDEIDKRPNLKKQDMERAIQRFITLSSGADVAVFYYAGHGQQPLKGGRNFLLPIDARIGGDDDLETEAVLADNIVRRLEEADKAARLRLVILDACRNNPKGWRVRADRGLAPIQTGDQFTLVGFSTNDRAPALDAVKGASHSPYAEALARWLSRSGELPVRRIFDQTAAEVRRVTGDKQMPRVSGDLPGDVLLSGHVLQDDFLALEAARAAASVAAYEEFLKRFSSSQLAARARIELAALLVKPPPPPPPPDPRVGQVIKDCDVCPELVVLPQDSFKRGSPDSELLRDKNEGPQRTVRIGYPLAVGRYEVTQGQWKAVMDRNPSRFSSCGDDCPVEQVSWDDVQEYLTKLNARSGQKYRLLSEAEWEYAARAGTTTPFHTGQTITPEQANFNGNYMYNGSAKGVYREKTMKVGSFGANAFGLYDMHGNVWEWVQDVWHDNYTEAPTDGAAWEVGGDSSRRVLRGGSWDYNPRGVRSAIRSSIEPYYSSSGSGFRIAKTF
jgi:formylglycine-generating enzyme required for sulfatase activity